MKRILIVLVSAFAVCVQAGADTRTIRRLDVSDVSQYVYNISHWFEQADLQEGQPMYGDETITVSSLPKSLAGLDWIQTSYFSRVHQGGGSKVLPQVRC